MSKCLKTLDWDEPYFKKYFNTLLSFRLEELLFLKETYYVFDGFSREIALVDHAIELKKSSLGAALC